MYGVYVSQQTVLWVSFGNVHQIELDDSYTILKSRKTAPSSQVRLIVRRFRDESVALEFKRELAERHGERDDSDDPDDL